MADIALYDVEALKNITKEYLKDAGFPENSYNIESLKDRYYLSIDMSEKAIDYLIKDLKKTKWVKIIEIIKYSKANNHCAIITFI